MYLALTGARIKAADLYAIGIASHVVAGEEVSAIIGALADANIASNTDASEVLNRFHHDPEPAPIATVMDMIDDHFDGTSVQLILESLESDQGDWAQKQLAVLKSKSPISMRVTHEQLTRGAALDSFRDNMRMEFGMVCRMMANPDFHEGVRAILLDKDNNPIWQPADLMMISEDEVQAHFAAFANPRDELQLV